MQRLKKLDKFRRSRQIISVFSKYGLNYLFDQKKIGLLAKFRGKYHSNNNLTPGANFCLALEELGPTFIKFGQILSTRPDFLPPAFIKELEKLQDQDPPFDSSKAVKIIEHELKKPISELFETFDPKPVASDSLCQVHRATIPDGRIVAVKIQRPDIEQTIELDLAILQDLAGFVENRFHNSWNYRPKLMVEEFKKAIRKELDFTKEGHNFEKFRINFRNIEYINVPIVYWELTTSVILTMEFIEGVKINEINQEQYKEVYNPELVAVRGAEAILKQILQDGFFHADPHPANLFVQPPANIIMLDVGMVGYLDKKTTLLGTKILQAVVSRNTDVVMSCLEDLKIIVKEVDRNMLQQELSELFDNYMDIPLKHLEMNILSRDLIRVMIRHNLTLPSNLVLMLKALSMVESTGKGLYPDLNMMNIAKPFVKRIRLKKINPAEFIKNNEATLYESIDLIEQLPENINVLIQKVREGKLKFVIDNQDSKKLTGSIERSGNHIALSVIIAALIIVSSMALMSRIAGPLVFGWPLLSVTGFSLAIILSVIMIISVLKPGRHHNQ